MEFLICLAVVWFAWCIGEVTDAYVDLTKEQTLKLKFENDATELANSQRERDALSG